MITRRGLWAILLSMALVGCSLGGDISPPASIATAQTVRASTPTVDVSLPQTDVESPATQTPLVQTQSSLSTQGTIIGVVANGTPGGSVPGNLEVNLVVSDEQALVFSTTTRADKNGSFTFDEVDVLPGRIYLTYVDYQDVRYVSDALHFPEGDTQLDLSLQIFETTDDDSGLRVRRLHLIFEQVDDNQIGVAQIWVVYGLEDRTVIEGDSVGVIDIHLPAGFSNLGIDDSISPEGRYLLSETGFIDRAPVQPGKPVELVFGFTLPYKSGFDYSQTMMYPVDAVVIMLVSEEISIHADGLVDLGRSEMAGFSMRSYSMDSLEDGEALTLRLGSKSAMFRGDNALLAYIFAAVLLIVAALFVLFRYVRKRQGAEDVDSTPRDFQGDYQALLKSIASLDDAFEAGELDEDEYRRNRAALKDQALRFMRGDDD